MIFYQLGVMTGADTVTNIAWVIVPLIVLRMLFWYAVLTTHYLYNAIENSIWVVVFFLIGIALCRLLPELNGSVRVVFVIAITGIVCFRAFLMTVDVPMYLSRWRARLAMAASCSDRLRVCATCSRRWVVTRDLAEWKDEILWMSLYFSAAVWSSLALCVCYSLEDQLLRYRTQATTAISSPAAPAASAHHTGAPDFTSL